MKKIPSALIALVGLSVVSASAVESVKKLGYMPAEIYACDTNGLPQSRVCEGAIPIPFTGNCRVILCARIFDPGFRHPGPYGVCTNIGSKSIVCFIDHPIPAGTNAENAGMIIATTTPDRVPHLTRHSAGPDYRMFLMPDPAPEIRGMTVTNVTSLLTRDRVAIAGVGHPLVTSEDTLIVRPDGRDPRLAHEQTVDIYQSYLMIRVDPDGADGEIFIDEHDRVYVLYGDPKREPVALAGPFTPSLAGHKLLPPTGVRSVSGPR